MTLTIGRSPAPMISLGRTDAGARYVHGSGLAGTGPRCPARVGQTGSGPYRDTEAELTTLQASQLLILALREKEVRSSLCRWAALAPAQSYHGTSLAISVGSEVISMPTSSQTRPLTSRSRPPIETLSMRCFTCSSALTRLSPSCFTSCFSCLTR